jgi:hypothetical protein
MSEEDPPEEPNCQSERNPAIERSDWLGLMVLISGFLFLAILALWDMVASLFR